MKSWYGRSRLDYEVHVLSASMFYIRMVHFVRLYLETSINITELVYMGEVYPGRSQSIDLYRRICVLEFLS